MMKKKKETMFGLKNPMGLCKEYLKQHDRAMGAPLRLEINPQYIASQVLAHHCHKFSKAKNKERKITDS